MHRVGKPVRRSRVTRAYFCACLLVSASPVRADGLLKYFDDPADAARTNQPD